MTQRCPYSVRLPSPHNNPAVLHGWEWQINTRGFANIIPSSNPSSVVYGIVYALTEEDEMALDGDEGVPWAYGKERVGVQWMTGEEGERKGTVEVEVLVYVDWKRTEEGAPREEYVGRMNRGIEDALDLGVPREWVEKVVRRWIPEGGSG